MTRQEIEIEALKNELGQLKIAGAKLAESNRTIYACFCKAIEERDHWKANHANMVEFNRQLRDRPDLEDRAKAVLDLREQLMKCEASKQALKYAIECGFSNTLDGIYIALEGHLNRIRNYINYKPETNTPVDRFHVNDSLRIITETLESSAGKKVI